jgi:hypothetical protein
VLNSIVFLAYGQPKSTEVIEVIRVSLKKGQVAPFDGQLLSNAAAAKLITDHKAQIDKLNLQISYLQKANSDMVDTQKKVCDTEKESGLLKLKSCEDTCESQKVVYQKALDRASMQCEKKWYENPYFNFALGAIVFGSTAAGLGYASHQ